jgi:hypothetical protein
MRTFLLLLAVVAALWLFSRTDKFATEMRYESSLPQFQQSKKSSGPVLAQPDPGNPKTQQDVPADTPEPPR